MNDVILGNIAELAAKGGQIAVIILSIVEHLALLRRSQAIEGVHERRLARARATHQRDEFTRGNAEGDITEQWDALIPGLFEADGIDANEVRLVILRQLVRLVDESIWPDAYLVTELEELICGRFGVDVGVILAVQVDNAIGTSLLQHAGVMRRDLWVRKDHCVVGHASNRDLTFAQANGLRQERFLLRARPVVVSERDEGAVLVPDAK